MLTTEIHHTLSNADGTRPSGTVTITHQAFTASDGSQVAAGTIRVTITNGDLHLHLAPSQNAQPDPQYQAHFLLDNGALDFRQGWYVRLPGDPPTPATLAQLTAPRPPLLPVQEPPMSQPATAALPEDRQCSTCHTRSATAWHILPAWQSRPNRNAKPALYLLLCGHCADFIHRLRRAAA